MAQFILKDNRGKENTFDHETIFVRGVDGELMPFTHGTGNPVLEELEVTENGNYTPSEGVDGFGSVSVNVAEEKTEIILEETTLTGFASNSAYGGLYTKDMESGVFEIELGKEYLVMWDGNIYDVIAEDASALIPGAVFIGNGTPMGLGGNGEPFAIGYTPYGVTLFGLDTKTSHTISVIKRVRHEDIFLQNKTITGNGEYTADSIYDGFGSVTVNVPEPEINLQDKTITENGTYSADSGYDGFGSVTVDVAGSGGGGSLPAGLYWKNDNDNMQLPNAFENPRYFTFKGSLYAITRPASSTKNAIAIHKYDGSAWTTKVSSYSLGGTLSWMYICPIEFNGKIHICGMHNLTLHLVYDDENGIVKLNNVPLNPADGYNSAFVEDGKLKYYCDTSPYSVYKWDETTDTWAEEGTLGFGYRFINYGGNVYCIKNRKLYKYESGNTTEVCALKNTDTHPIVAGDYVYGMYNSSNGNCVDKINMSTFVVTTIGRTPAGSSNTNNYNLVYYDNEIRLIGADGTNRENLIMYEVTE